MTGNKRNFLIFVALVLMFTMTATNAWAYFDRGPVKVNAAQSNVSVAVGKSITVSVSTSPSSDKQLPGCGMAECPQSCGEKNCLNAYGECTCAGTTYKTYYTDVNVSLGNSSVAKASYSNGVLTIKGVSAGETDIKVTAMLRQYTSTSQTIHVAVTGNGAGQSIGKTSAANAPATGSVEVVNEESPADSVDSQMISDSQQDEVISDSQQDEDNYAVNSDKGLIHFVAIQDGAMGKADMAAVMGKNESVVFQKKDTSGTVLYSWEFAGMDLQQPGDMDFSIVMDNNLPDILKSQVKGEAMYIDFAHEGALPGKATVNVQVGDAFAEGAALTLYYYNEETGQLEPVAEQLNIENGYVSFQIDHCSAYVLAAGDLAGAGFPWWGVAIIVVVAVVVIAIVMAARRRKTA